MLLLDAGGVLNFDFAESFLMQCHRFFKHIFKRIFHLHLLTLRLFRLFVLFKLSNLSTHL